MHLNKLNDISKIAAVQASVALSKLINAPVGVDIIPAKKVELPEFPSFMQEDKKTIAITDNLSGNVKGIAVLLFQENTARLLCDLLLNRNKGSTKQFDDIEISTLTELGNILIGNFLGPFSYSLKLDSIMHHVPDFKSGTYDELMESIMDSANSHMDDKLMVEIIINLDQIQFRSILMFLFAMSEMKNMLNQKDDG